MDFKPGSMAKPSTPRNAFHMHVKRDFGGESNGMAFSIGNISEMKEIHLRYSFWLFYRNVSFVNEYNQSVRL